MPTATVSVQDAEEAVLRAVARRGRCRLVGSSVDD
jgi:hypothetical protein